MGIGLVAVAVVMPVLVFCRVFLAAQQLDPLGGVDEGFPGEQILHKLLQPSPGNHQDFRRLSGLDLADVQGVVVQAGHLLGDQSRHGKGGSRAQLPGKFIHRQGGGGDLGRGSGSTPRQTGQRQRQAQNDCGFFHENTVLGMWISTF